MISCLLSLSGGGRGCQVPYNNYIEKKMGGKENKKKQRRREKGERIKRGKKREKKNK
jgi:hypothetical protein